MKKIIAAFTMMLAFSISINAQDNKITPEMAAKKDAAELTEYLGLNETQNADFFRLFEMKHTVTLDPQMSDERKKEMRRVVEAKMMASLTADEIEKLNQNQDLKKKLLK
jgi:ATP phosphoribosyltransferase regulatory subunit HisZ